NMGYTWYGGSYPICSNDVYPLIKTKNHVKSFTTSIACYATPRFNVHPGNGDHLYQLCIDY
ncbi:hypothetical protein KAS14_03035, partial [Candidatus Bathyarchaeota archaeon]|nr:hypothetical protein [Candidatus Bathyarchaeota archaeon]